MSKTNKVHLFLLIAFFFLLRFAYLDQSFWLDETIQALVSQKGFDYYFHQHLLNDFNPPLYYFLTIAWTKVFPITEVLFRLPSLIFFVLSSFLVYQISQLLSSSKKIHLSALFLTLTSPLLLYYSQEARPYMMATFTALASTLFFLKFTKEKDFKNLFLHSFFLTLSIFTHYTALLIFPSYLLYIFFTNQKVLKKYLLSWILPFVLFLLYSPVFLSQLNHSQLAHRLYPGWFLVIGKSNLKSLFLFFTKFIIGRISFSNKVFYFLFALFLIPLYWLPAITRKKSSAPTNFLFLFLLLPPFLGFLISFRSPFFDYFRFLFCLPYLYVLIAQNSHPFLTKLLISLNLLFSLLYLLNPAFHREDWKSYCRYLTTNYPQIPVLILKTVDTPFQFYCPNQPVIPVTPQNITAKIKDQSAFLLTDYALPIFDPQGVIHQTLLENYFPKEKENFHLIQTTLYKNPL